MESLARRAKRAALAQIAPSQRQDPAVRQRMSVPAIRTFLNVAQAWQLNNEESRALLGWPLVLSSLKTILETGHAMPMMARRWAGPPE